MRGPLAALPAILIAGTLLIAGCSSPPGPPGLITRDPIRCAGSLAGSLITGSENRRQPGRW